MTDELTDRTITTKEERVNSVEATPNPPETVLRRTKKDFRDMFFFNKFDFLREVAKNVLCISGRFSPFRK